MPCYLVITIELKDMEIAKKALEEMCLIENKDYTLYGNSVSLKNTSLKGTLLQKYGVIKSEVEARRKGYRTQRITQSNGTIQLVLTK